MGKAGNLFRAWGVPPFSVFEPRQDYWKERKRWWISLGIKSEEGRRGDLLFKSQARLDEIQRGEKGGGPAFIDGYRIKEGKKKVPSNQVMGSKPVFRFGYDYDKSKEMSQDEVYRLGTSIFDPVLCELYYRWFCPPNGHILDPFAGGSVRGVLAAAMGCQYTGIELRGEQVDSNAAQWKELAARHPQVFGDKPTPRWFQGDSTNCKDIAPGEYDSIFTCPPYYDLEVYCDDAKDLSNMTWKQFVDQYTLIIANACSMLKPNRFATYIVTELRDEKGVYRRFPEVTVEAFVAAGCSYYNEAILVTAVGSLPVRVGNQFRASRKLGRTHQNILTFVKGDPAVAAKACSSAEEEIAKDPGRQKAVQGDLFSSQEEAEPEEAPAPVEHSQGSGAVPGDQADLFGSGPTTPPPVEEIESVEELEGDPQATPAEPENEQPATPPGPAQVSQIGGGQASGGDDEADGEGEAEGVTGAPDAEPSPQPTPASNDAEGWF